MRNAMIVFLLLAASDWGSSLPKVGLTVFENLTDDRVICQELNAELFGYLHEKGGASYEFISSDSLEIMGVDTKNTSLMQEKEIAYLIAGKAISFQIEEVIASREEKEKKYESNTETQPNPKRAEFREFADAKKTVCDSVASRFRDFQRSAAGNACIGSSSSTAPAELLGLDTEIQTCLLQTADFLMERWASAEMILRIDKGFCGFYGPGNLDPTKRMERRVVQRKGYLCAGVSGALEREVAAGSYMFQFLDHEIKRMPESVAVMKTWKYEVVHNRRTATSGVLWSIGKVSENTVLPEEAFRRSVERNFDTIENPNEAIGIRSARSPSSLPQFRDEFIRAACRELGAKILASLNRQEQEMPAP